MLIDIPVTIIFDCQRTTHDAMARGITKVITVRYDTEKHDIVAQITRGYLPDEKTIWQADPAELVMGQLFDNDLDRIAARAAANPYDYLAGTFTEDQRQTAQDKADQDAAQEGPQT